MKKLFLLLVGFCFAYTASAQVEQGKIALGGNLFYSGSSSKSQAGSQTQKQTGPTHFSFGPRFSYFISDGISLGASLLYEVITEPDYWGGSSNTYRDNNFIVSPNIRYHKSIGEKFYFFIEGMAHIGTGKVTEVNGNSNREIAKQSLIGLSINPGLIYFPSEKVGLELSFNGIGYTSVTSKPSNFDRKSVDNSYHIGPDTFAPRLGVQVYF